MNRSENGCELGASIGHFALDRVEDHSKRRNGNPVYTKTEKVESDRGDVVPVDYLVRSNKVLNNSIDAWESGSRLGSSPIQR